MCVAEIEENMWAMQEVLKGWCLVTVENIKALLPSGGKGNSQQIKDLSA